MCDATTNTCGLASNSPIDLKYDFTQGSFTGASTWVASQSATGTGPAFTIAKDWFVATPY